MATIPRRDVQALAAAQERLTSAARAAAESLVASWLDGHPSATVAEAREATMSIVGSVVGRYGGSLASVALSVSEGALAADGVELGEYDAPDVDSEAIERAVRYQAGRLAAGDRDGFVRSAGDAASYHTRSQASRAVIGRVESLRSGGGGGRRARALGRGDVAYARVPTGAETCAYCMMLASRGVAYHSEGSAGHANHRGCNCLVVAGTKGSTIEGIDFQEQYRAWKEMEAVDGRVSSGELAGGAGRAIKGLLVSGEDNVSILRSMRTEDDPMVDLMGPAEDSNPEELEHLLSSLKEMGVELVEQAQEDIAYQPGIRPGERGRLCYAPGMSYAAWLHEYTHAVMDHDLGLPGYLYYLSNPSVWDRFEASAYKAEVELAVSMGYNEVGDVLESLFLTDLRRRGRI